MKEAPFRVGEDVVVSRLGKPFEHYNEQIGMIVGELMQRTFLMPSGAYTEAAYRVEMPDKFVFVITPPGLARPLPKRGELDRITGWEQFRLATNLPRYLIERFKGPRHAPDQDY